jgi:hypothetical protein
MLSTRFRVRGIVRQVLNVYGAYLFTFAALLNNVTVLYEPPERTAPAMPAMVTFRRILHERSDCEGRLTPKVDSLPRSAILSQVTGRAI